MPKKKPSPVPLLTIVEAPVAALTPHPNNPRRISEARFKALVRSLKATPEMVRARPVVALPNGHIIMGNMRYRAAVELGWETIPAFYAELSEAEAAQWMLRDNNQYGEWDDGGLEEMLAKLHAAGADLDLTGFTEEQVHKILDATGVVNVEIQPVMNEHMDGIQRFCWWPGICVPITEADAETLKALHEHYLETNGVDFGLITKLLEAARGSGLLPPVSD